MKKLKTGTNLIRTFLVLGIILSLTGLFTTLWLDMYDRIFLAALYAFNAIFMVSVIWILVTRKLVVRIKQIAGAMNKAADGELTERVSFMGESEMSLLAENFNSMMERLAGAITKVHSSLFELRNISGTIRQLSENGVSSAAIQSEGLKKTSMEIREINRSITDISESVVTLSTLSSSNTESMTGMSQSLESTTSHLESLVQSVEEVSSSIIEMASAVRQIEENAAILATDTTRTAELVNEMDRAIKQIGSQAADTSRIAETVKKDAEEGWKAVDATITGINEIRSSSAITFDAIENLSKRVANIGTILSVIDEVAEQTNLLALNASIIAAQAGERGKSFSVVAMEIKNLAKRTGSNTKEISDIILGVREDTERAVKAITLSEKRISEGSTLSQRSGEALLKIVDGIQAASSQMMEINTTAVSQAEASRAMRLAMDNVAEMVEQIARATQEQSDGSELITTAVERMRKLTREVMHSISTHQNSACQVVNANEEINVMVTEICDASLLQSSSAERIGESLKEIEESTDVHVTSTLVMDEVLVKLAQQIEALQYEMGRFKV
ncbi:MAG: HAMP domain-containing protein [Geobacteraceae bacterium]|nr:HAMP domain-containing protein [Geobacteraceae bacterium]NTW80204.1 HAMP domain-containing protein [Geobacteraceae bacterium]